MDLEMSPDVVVSKPKEPSLWLPLFAFGVGGWGIFGKFWKIMGDVVLLAVAVAVTVLRFYLREKGVFLEKKVCVWRKRCIFVS